MKLEMTDATFWLPQGRQVQRPNKLRHVCFLESESQDAKALVEESNDKLVINFLQDLVPFLSYIFPSFLLSIKKLFTISISMQ